MARCYTSATAWGPNRDMHREEVSVCSDPSSESLTGRHARPHNAHTFPGGFAYPRPSDSLRATNKRTCSKARPP